MWRDALLIAVKDLRIEKRSRVVTNQIAPFALVVLVLFAIAFDADRQLLTRVAAGLFWITTLFAALLAVNRSFAVETDGGAKERLLTMIDSGGVFLGKTLAVSIQLFVLEVLLIAGIVVLYDTELHSFGVLLLSAILATVGIAAIGIVYGALAASLRNAATVLPLLTLPLAAPVVLATSRVWESALEVSVADPWTGMSFLAVFALVYVAIGIVSFDALLEEG